MLQRMLEPEVMDSGEEARDYDSMDHTDVNRRFVADLREVLNLRDSILDVGTGTGQIPIELCRQVPEARVIAIDLAEHMLALARVNVANAGLENAIRVERADAKRLPYEDDRFSTVISNSIVHHIPDPFVSLSEMNRVCERDGTLFIRDLLRPVDLTTLRNLVEQYTAGANEHQRRMFSKSLHAALTLDEIRELIGRLGYPPEVVRQTSDRHWTLATTRL
jgi:ubiquinone/menaquinone biosynthesis C-methylase UbiE